MFIIVPTTNGRSFFLEAPYPSGLQLTPLDAEENLCTSTCLTLLKMFDDNELSLTRYFTKYLKTTGVEVTPEAMGLDLLMCFREMPSLRVPDLTNFFIEACELYRLGKGVQINIWQENSFAIKVRIACGHKAFTSMLYLTKLKANVDHRLLLELTTGMSFSTSDKILMCSPSGDPGKLETREGLSPALLNWHRASDDEYNAIIFSMEEVLLRVNLNVPLSLIRRSRDSQSSKEVLRNGFELSFIEGKYDTIGVTKPEIRGRDEIVTIHPYDARIKYS